MLVFCLVTQLLLSLSEKNCSEMQFQKRDAFKPRTRTSEEIVCMYVCMHVCVYACMRACVHACMYVMYVCL
jgi:hypothetical protein